MLDATSEITRSVVQIFWVILWKLASEAIVGQNEGLHQVTALITIGGAILGALEILIRKKCSS